MDLPERDELPHPLLGDAPIQGTGEASKARGEKIASCVSQVLNHIQGEPSDSSKPIVDIDMKVAFSN